MIFPPPRGHARPIPQLYPPAPLDPALDLAFAARGSLGPLVTFTRGSSATFINAAGLVSTAATNAPRFTHDPVTLAPRGLLIEEARTNLLLNSAALATQSVAVSAVAYTLSFSGTGTVTLSGASTAGPLVGIGTGPANRVALTFTAAAGSLTLTVTGTVANAQLEAGAFATSYIPTTGAAATRAADVASISGAAFAGFYNAAEGTLVVSGRVPAIAAGVSTLRGLVTVAEAAGFSNRIVVGHRHTQFAVATTVAAGVTEAFISAALAQPGPFSVAFAYKTGDSAAAVNGGAATASAAALNTGVTRERLLVGASDGGTNPGVTIARLRYYRRRLPNASLQALTA